MDLELLEGGMTADRKVVGKRLAREVVAHITRDVTRQRTAPHTSVAPSVFHDNVAQHERCRQDDFWYNPPSDDWLTVVR